MTLPNRGAKENPKSSKLHVRHACGVRPPLPVAERETPFTFVQQQPYDAAKLALSLSPDGAQIDSSSSFDVEEGLFERLSALSDPAGLRDDDRDMLIKLTGLLSGAEKWLLDSILQELQVAERHSLVYRGGGHWSTDNDSWHQVPTGVVLAGIHGRPLLRMDNEWHGHIQALFDVAEKPFMAMYHLREAQCSDGRFAWIQATVAAELGIKEALLRLEPRLRGLLLEVPSPPLRKLYGSLLKTYGGEKSPYVNELDKGAYTRNLLVHRPESVPLNPQAVVDYVSTVEKALHHLIRLCRKHDRTRQTDVVSGGGR